MNLGTTEIPPAWAAHPSAVAVQLQKPWLSPESCPQPAVRRRGWGSEEGRAGPRSSSRPPHRSPRWAPVWTSSVAEWERPAGDSPKGEGVSPRTPRRSWGL